MASIDEISRPNPVGRDGRQSRLKSAVLHNKPVGKVGLQERLFVMAFSGLVYPQIWEDPVIDMEALQLKDGEHLVGIASGGCNILSYLTTADIRVTAIDLNPSHIALNKLKIAAARYLPDYSSFHKLFAEADSLSNERLYFDHIAPHLDEQSRKYWEGRNKIGRRRLGYFQTNLYKHGLLGSFIAATHWLARMHGRDPRKLLTAKTMAEQRQIFDREFAPLFERRHVRWLLNKPAALFGLGIPPSQYEALKGNEAHMSTVLRARLERLACGFDLKDNYFAWQAFGRRYKTGDTGALPPYLQRQNFELVQTRAKNVAVEHRLFTEFLASQPARSVNAYVLLDAQDWMSDEVLTGLWTEIDRTAAPGARVIFRTAGEDTILPGRIPEAILRRFSYDVEDGRAWTARDRSSIYGGFHRYTRQPEAAKLP
jgi:S-adenosylmethionine-diacylglycerol 3-amino-3-carboxypropyl transferase